MSVHVFIVIIEMNLCIWLRDITYFDQTTDLDSFFKHVLCRCLVYIFNILRSPKGQHIVI